MVGIWADGPVKGAGRALCGLHSCWGAWCCSSGTRLVAPYARVRLSPVGAAATQTDAWAVAAAQQGKGSHMPRAESSVSCSESAAGCAGSRHSVRAGHLGRKGGLYCLTQSTGAADDLEGTTCVHVARVHPGPHCVPGMRGRVHLATCGAQCCKPCRAASPCGSAALSRAPLTSLALCRAPVQPHAARPRNSARRRRRMPSHAAIASRLRT